MLDSRLPDYLTERSDQCVFAARPMLMVPMAGALPACQMHETRLLAARDGIYVESRAPALHATVRVAAVDLPYGAVQSHVTLTGGRLPAHLLRAFVEQAREAAPKETAALVTLAYDERYVIHQPTEYSASVGQVCSRELDDDSMLAFDIHSHGQIPAYFSGTDDESDRSRVGPYIALVVGEVDRSGRPSLVARLCVSPYLIDLDPRNLVDPAGLYVEEIA